LANKDFKVKNKLVISGLTNANGVLLAENHVVDSHTNLATQYGGTGTTTSPTSGQIPYSASGTTYTPTALNTLDVKGSSYSADAPSSPVVGQIWVESDSTADSFDPNIIRRQSFTATAGQTEFTTSVSFIEGYEQVFFNGLLLLRTTDYTTSGGNTVTLGVAAALNDIVEVVTVTNLNSVNTYTQGEIDTALSAKLSTSTAASTYLTQSNASSTYLTQANATSTYLTQTNAASTYVPQSSYFVAGKNKIINGNFGVWQRGTSTTLSSGTQVYSADRWLVSSSFSAGSSTFSQQTFAPGTAPVAGYESQYFGRITCGSTATGFNLYQRIEDVRTFAGQTVTFSFWAKSSATPQIQVYLAQIFGSGGSANVDYYSGAVVLTNTWTRYSKTVSLSSLSGKTIGTSNNLTVGFYYDNGTINSATIDVWGFQIEAGSAVTPFTTASGSIGGELALCQRYFWRYAPDISTNTTLGSGLAISSTRAIVPVRYPVVMRTTPSFAWSGTSGHFRVMYGGYSTADATTISFNSGGTQAFELDLIVASGLTTGNAVLAGTASSSAFMNLSAEL
jgi:hypothetical protein